MKSITNKIYEGFFDNVGVGKELIFLQDLKNTLDNWKNSFDKDFPINLLERLCYKAQRENFNFDICIENNSNFGSVYATVIKFWNKYYEVSDRPDGRPANNDCWTVNHGTNINRVDSFNPSTTNCNIYRVGEYIDQYVKRYAGGSKRNLIFKVRISLDNPKHTNWI